MFVWIVLLMENSPKPLSGNTHFPGLCFSFFAILFMVVLKLERQIAPIALFCRMMTGLQARSLDVLGQEFRVMGESFPSTHFFHSFLPFREDTFLFTITCFYNISRQQCTVVEK